MTHIAFDLFLIKELGLFFKTILYAGLRRYVR